MTSKDESEVIEKRPAPRYSSTQAIHVGYDPDMPGSGAVVPPIVLSTTFKMKSSTSTVSPYTFTCCIIWITTHYNQSSQWRVFGAYYSTERSIDIAYVCGVQL